MADTVFPYSFISHFSKEDHQICVRRICKEHQVDSLDCTKSEKYIFQMPLSIFSNHETVYLFYKKEVLNNLLDIELDNCEVVHGGSLKRVIYLVENFSNEDIKLTFEVRYKKVKEKKDGFYCRNFSWFRLDIRYTDSFLAKWGK